MQQNGRKSATSVGDASHALSVVTSLRTRPEPPSDLNKREREIWTSVVNPLPVDWFSAPDLPLLYAYVVAVAKHERVTRLTRDAEPTIINPTGAEVANPVFRVQDMLARQIASLAVKMRLSQSAKWDEQKANTKWKRGVVGGAQPAGDGTSGKPWG
jgi:phage terminase small subunit